MAAFLSDYGLFVLELVTVAVIVVVAALAIISAARKSPDSHGLVIDNINETIERRADTVRQSLLGRRDARRQAKQRDKARKKGKKSESGRRRIFVLDFKGDIRASATASLREEVTAVLTVAGDGDEVLLRLENSGGAVHEHGLAASQLLRLRERGIPLTIVVDKVAASGGYLMAAVADKIVAAPFAIIGSIGVLLQLPNFHRLLGEKGIDFELLTAGKYKRTLTLFGENTDEGREKMQQELVEVHELFKQQIKEQRPALDLERIATGEHWYGRQALELGLIDEIGTSDTILLQAVESADLYRVSYKRRKNFFERMMQGAEGLLRS
ncbi:MAG: protease SohB [Gammaproteobacteria bacterium]|nr:protease SohB [Gammaproteobacteria bacterium]